MVAAAEKRQVEQETRGIKNVDAVKKQQRLDEERRKREEVAGSAPNQGPLKVIITSLNNISIIITHDYN